MKAHTFIFDAAAYALEAYITVDKYKDAERHNQFSKIQTQHELKRLSQIYKEFTGLDIITELEGITGHVKSESDQQITATVQRNEDGYIKS